MAESRFEVLPNVFISSYDFAAMLRMCAVHVSPHNISLWADRERADAYRWANTQLMNPMPDFLDCYRKSQLELVQQHSPYLHDDNVESLGRIVDIEAAVSKCMPGGNDAA